MHGDVKPDFTGDDFGHVAVWDASADEQVGSVIATPGGFPVALAWQPDGDQLAVVADNNVVGFFDEQTHEQVGQPIESADSRFLALAFSPDGSRLATSAGSGIVRQWSTTTHREVGPPLKGHVGGRTRLQPRRHPPGDHHHRLRHDAPLGRGQRCADR